MSILNQMYDAVVETVRSLSPEKKKTVRDSIAEEIAKDETSNQLLSEIKKLAHRAASVDEAFGSVRSGLKMLDEQNLKDKDGTPILKFHSRWVEFQKVSL